MRFKRNRSLAKKISLTLALVIVGGMVFSGCYGATQPKGWSGATVSGDRLFAGTLDGHAVALQTADGQPLPQWESNPEAGVLGTTQTAIYGTPAVGDEFIYVAGYNGKVYAFVPDTGSLRWIYPREGNLAPIVGGIAHSQGKVFFCDADGLVYALDATTGDRLWSAETGDKIWVTPTVAGDVLYVVSFDRKLYALNIADGSEKWQYEAEQILTTQPLVDDNTIYVGSFDRYMYAVDAATGSLKWQSSIRGGKWFWAQPVIYNGVLYAPNLDGKVYFFDAVTGRDLAPAVDLGSPISSSPVLVTDKVIVATEEDGKVYRINAVDFQKDSLPPFDATLALESHRIPKNTDRKIFAPLSASEGTVYVKAQSGSQDVLFAVDVATMKALWGQLLTKE